MRHTPGNRREANTLFYESMLYLQTDVKEIRILQYPFQARRKKKRIVILKLFCPHSNNHVTQVVYDADGFLEKNRDTLSLNVTEAFRNSENSLVVRLFCMSAPGAATTDLDSS